MQITGQVKKVHPIESVGANGFQKRRIWIETEQDSKYPQLVEVVCEGKKVGVADGINEGDVVEIEANLNGREYNDKVFNTISVGRVTVKVKANVSQNAPVPPAPGEPDDLPF
jgi:uncharacterized protein (DUF2126 family)